MASGIAFSLLPAFVWFASQFYSAAADVCGDGTICTYDCCYDYDYYYYYCCNTYSVVYSWWFWFMWGFILLIILTTCCAIIRRRQLRRRQVIVVQQGYTTPTAYGTLVNTETPQQPYVPPNYNQVGGYQYPPPGPAPPYQPGEVQPAQPVQQAQAAPSKQGEEQYNPNDKPPPPYNPNS